MTKMCVEAGCLKELPGIVHGFFTRSGGISRDLYEGLNCGYGSQDDTGNVDENRALVAGFLGTQAKLLVTPNQYHSAEVITITAPYPKQEAPKADAIVTKTPALAIGVLTADCVPVLFADMQEGIVAAAHSGWRGAISGVLENTVNAMQELGSRREDIAVAVGPAISGQVYEVGPEFKADFIENAPGNEAFFFKPTTEARDHFDLPAYVCDRLAQLNLGSMENIGHCTYKRHTQYYSFRRSVHKKEADYGRQISAIMIV